MSVSEFTRYQTKMEKEFVNIAQSFKDLRSVGVVKPLSGHKISFNQTVQAHQKQSTLGKFQNKEKNNLRRVQQKQRKKSSVTNNLMYRVNSQNSLIDSERDFNLNFDKSRKPRKIRTLEPKRPALGNSNNSKSSVRVGTRKSMMPQDRANSSIRRRTKFRTISFKNAPTLIYSTNASGAIINTAYDPRFLNDSKNSTCSHKIYRDSVFSSGTNANSSKQRNRLISEHSSGCIKSNNKSNDHHDGYLENQDFFEENDELFESLHFQRSNNSNNSFNARLRYGRYIRNQRKISGLPGNPGKKSRQSIVLRRESRYIGAGNMKKCRLDSGESKLSNNNSDHLTNNDREKLQIEKEILVKHKIKIRRFHEYNNKMMQRVNSNNGKNSTVKMVQELNKELNRSLSQKSRVREKIRRMNSEYESYRQSVVTNKRERESIDFDIAETIEEIAENADSEEEFINLGQQTRRRLKAKKQKEKPRKTPNSLPQFDSNFLVPEIPNNNSLEETDKASIDIKLENGLIYQPKKVESGRSFIQRQRLQRFLKFRSPLEGKNHRGEWSLGFNFSFLKIIIYANYTQLHIR